MPNAIHALLFDLDDTLYSRSATFRRWAQVFVRDDLEFAEDDPRYQETIEHIITMDAWGYSPRETLFRNIKEAHHPLLQDSVNSLLQTYNRRFMDHLPPAEETLHLLKALKGASLPFGIVTNGTTHRQSRKIHALGFAQLTSCIFISEQFGSQKPDPSIFLAAASCLGYEPANILFVGDSAQNDIGGAQQVGMHTAWLHHQRQWPAELIETPPDYTLDSLANLYPILEVA
jgi:putative hydrolase of the HAD superfamily